MSFCFHDSIFWCKSALFWWIQFISFFSCCLCFCCYIHEVVAKSVSWSFPLFSPKGFILFKLFMFRSVVHFELIFVYGISKGLASSFHMSVIQFSEYHLSKDYTFSIECFWRPFWKSVGCICEGIFLYCVFCLIGLYICSYTIAITL